MLSLAIGSLGTPELVIIMAVLMLFFGASKLPDLARGSGRAIRIFKAETKGLVTDDDDDLRSSSVLDVQREQQGRGGDAAT